MTSKLVLVTGVSVYQIGEGTLEELEIYQELSLT